MKRSRFLTQVVRAVRGRKRDSGRPVTRGPQFELSDRELLHSYEASCSWPDLYYDKIQSLIELKTPSRIVEIGVAYGYHARQILSSNRNLNYVGIDPYVAGYDEDDLFFRDVAKLFDSAPNEAMNRLYRAVAEGLENDFGNRASIYREESVTAAKRFGDSSLPFVFLDANHRYEAVLEDLEMWWPKIAPGGVLCGDDFLWSGVRTAVVDFFSSVGRDVFLLQSPSNDHISFYAVKPASKAL